MRRLAFRNAQTRPGHAHFADACTPPSRPGWATTNAMRGSANRSNLPGIHPALHAGRTGKTRGRNGSHLPPLGSPDAGPAATEHPRTAAFTGVTVIAGVTGRFTGKRTFVGKAAYGGAGGNAKTDPGNTGSNTSIHPADAEAIARVAKIRRPGRGSWSWCRQRLGRNRRRTMRYTSITKTTQPTAHRIRDRVRGRSKTLWPETEIERGPGIPPRVGRSWLVSWRSSRHIRRRWPSRTKGTRSCSQPYAGALITDTTDARAPAATTGRVPKTTNTDIAHSRHATGHALRGSVHRI